MAQDTTCANTFSHIIFSKDCLLYGDPGLCQISIGVLHMAVLLVVAGIRRHLSISSARPRNLARLLEAASGRGQWEILENPRMKKHFVNS